MRTRYILLLIIGLDAFILCNQIEQISISKHEAAILYGDFSFLQFIIKESLSLFGQNDLALRLPMIFWHVGSVLLLYMISKDYLSNERNRIWLILTYVLIPGVMSSAVLVDSAGMVIFFLFLFIYLYKRVKKKYIYQLLFIYMLLGGGFLYLFLALAFYAAHKGAKRFALYNLALFLLSLYFYGFDTTGLPEGHFLDSLGIYAAIFTPIIFVYLFYVLYRRGLSKKFDLLWFISITALLYSLFFSFRQRVEVEHFAPYLLIALPLAAQTFEHSYRIRLKQFRKNYKLLFSVSIVFLACNTLLVLFNQSLYSYLEKPEKHFAYKVHIAKELAQGLENIGVTCVTSSKSMQQRLAFYGVTKCDTYKILKTSKEKCGDKFVTIGYIKNDDHGFCVTKINKI